MLQFWNILYCRWKKTSDNRKFIVERRNIRSLRVKYLRTIRAYREEGRPIAYADETYIHISHTTSYACDDGSGALLKAPISKGRRLIIVHAGNSTLTFRHRASCILGQAFHYSPENAFCIFNQQIYFII